MENYYKNKIEELRRQNQEAIEKLLKEFKLNLQKVQAEYEDSKRTAKQLQDIYEKKLDSQENEHEEEIVDINGKHTGDRELLKEQWDKLKTIQEEMKRTKKTLENDREAAENLMNKAKKKKKAIKKLLEDKIKQINLLE